jgi:hypothetical protein
VSGRSVAGGGSRDDIGDVLGGGLGREDAEGEGRREKASMTTASLKDQMRKRDGTAVRSAIQTWFG